MEDYYGLFRWAHCNDLCSLKQRDFSGRSRRDVVEGSRDKMREKGRSRRLKTWEEIDPPLTGLEDRGKEPWEGNVDGPWNPTAIKEAGTSVLQSQKTELGQHSDFLVGSGEKTFFTPPFKLTCK